MIARANTTAIELLYDDILSHILQYLPIQFLLKVCLCVSKHFHRIILNIPNLELVSEKWNSFHDAPITRNNFLQFIKSSHYLRNLTSLQCDLGEMDVSPLTECENFKNLTCLQIRSTDATSLKTLAHSSNLTKLNKFMLGFGRYSDHMPNISVLQTLVQSQNFSNVKELHLEFTCFHQDIVKVISESQVLKLSGNLTVLSLSGVIIGFEDAQCFSQAEAFRNLKTLQLNECSLESPRNQLSQGLSIQHYNSLTKRNECLGGMGLIALEKKCHFSKNLTSLTINSSNLVAADLKEIIYFEQLKTLNLYRNRKIGSNGAQYLATSCENLKTLTCLNLSWCGIGGEGFMYLIRCPYWNHLETLSVSNNNIQEHHALQSLGEEGVLLQQHLTYLDLTFNDIDHEGIIALAQSCEKFHRLQHVHVSATSLNESAAKSVLNCEKFAKLKTFSLHAVCHHELYCELIMKKFPKSNVYGFFKQERKQTCQIY
ncbi:hypothetical protein C9374_012175 [Naegleria lovaniensis]|uniref:F-box domain-containing protein n=1 Tax=Naegleria lovaniensis TaxID=51637 RepID=A0AA88GBJ7_NAELO|nr:uncharacterized protein C9374_012175 [Naegleria lovaniensis]KAG2373436.1 hypothetical protein C9374_012175 [Naegleria lovaniensis]